jgi:hypothetical protein
MFFWRKGRRPSEDSASQAPFQRLQDIELDDEAKPMLPKQNSKENIKRSLLNTAVPQRSYASFQANNTVIFPRAMTEPEKITPELETTLFEIKKLVSMPLFLHGKVKDPLIGLIIQARRQGSSEQRLFEHLKHLSHYLKRVPLENTENPAVTRLLTQIRNASLDHLISDKRLPTIIKPLIQQAMELHVKDDDIKEHLLCNTYMMPKR